MKPQKLHAIQKLGLPFEFPARFFPRPIEAYRRMIAKSADTNDDFAIGHLLVASATAIGRNVSANPLPTWRVIPNLFIAIIGHKGEGKSSLASAAFAPLIAHEEQQASKATAEHEALVQSRREGGCGRDYGDDDDDDEDDDGYDDDACDDDYAPLPELPPVILTDVTGPAITRELAKDPRQLLINTDELATVFIRNSGGTDRQLLCELADGRRRRQCRATQRGPSKAIENPYVCLLGCLTPDLLKMAYGARGDDGCLDRFLLVGTGEARRASWPDDVHDADLTRAWENVIGQLLQIETVAMDAVDGKLSVPVSPEAVEQFKDCIERMHLVADAVRTPSEQRGVVAKLKGFIPKLALLRRCLRWAAGEFCGNGPVGEIDADDARAACEAVEFFLGRWLLWRPELIGARLPSGEPIGLAHDPGDDPALLVLQEEAIAAHRNVRVYERLIRHLRRSRAPANVASLAVSGPMATATIEALRGACEWLVASGLATWSPDGQQISLVR